MQISVFWRYFSSVTCLLDWLRLRWQRYSMDIKHTPVFFRQEWPLESGAVKCSYCVYSVRGQIVLPRSHILRLVVNLFVLLVLCSEIQMAYPPGVCACMRLSWKIWLDWVLVLHCSPLQVSVSAQAQCLITDRNQLQWNRVTTWDCPFLILISSNESISGMENNSLGAMKFI